MEGKGQVGSCLSKEELQREIQRGSKSNKLVVVDFTATSSGQFHLTSPVLKDLPTELIDIIFLTVDVNKLKSVADEWGVVEIPTFYVVKEGTPVARTIGEKKDDLLMNIAKFATTTGPLINILCK